MSTHWQTRRHKNQLRQPYQGASPDHNRKDDKGVPLFAIPGNHDWYDGLVQFAMGFILASGFNMRPAWPIRLKERR